MSGSTSQPSRRNRWRRASTIETPTNTSQDAQGMVCLDIFYGRGEALNRPRVKGIDRQGRKGFGMRENERGGGAR